MVKEIDILKYGTNKSLIPTTTPQEIYRYSDSMLKHVPKNALKMFEKDLLSSKKAVIILGNKDRRSHDNASEAQRKNANLKIGRSNLACSSMINMFIEFP